MSDVDSESLSGGASPRWFKARWFKIFIGGLVALVAVGVFVFASYSSTSKEDNGYTPVSYTEINNDSIKPHILKIIESSVAEINSSGGEMNYFVKGYNVDLSVYNPNAVLGKKAASYLGNPEGNGGSYSSVPDNQNFTTILNEKLIPRKDDTFAIWSWDGDSEYTNGYLLADVGINCKSPSIGEKPTFKMCEKVIPNGVSVLVEDGKVSQVLDVTNTSGKATRVLTYGVTQAVNGVLTHVYG